MDPVLVRIATVIPDGYNRESQWLSSYTGSSENNNSARFKAFFVNESANKPQNFWQTKRKRGEQLQQFRRNVATILGKLFQHNLMQPHIHLG